MSSSPQPTWPAPHKACLALPSISMALTGKDAMLNGSIWHKPEYFGFGGYGPYRALPRILDLLDEFRIPTTFSSSAAWARTDTVPGDMSAGTRCGRASATNTNPFTLRRWTSKRT